jgi:hypothetical protein
MDAILKKFVLKMKFKLKNKCQVGVYETQIYPMKNETICSLPQSHETIPLSYNLVAYPLNPSQMEHLDVYSKINNSIAKADL